MAKAKNRRRIFLIWLGGTILLGGILTGVALLSAPMIYPQSFLDAARRGDVEKVRMLLDKGVDINHRDSWSGTAMFYAAGYDHKEVVSLLLERGVEVNQQYRMNKTALIIASQRGCEATVRFLLDNGADISIKDRDGMNAMMHAVENEHSTIVEILTAACRTRKC